MSQRANYFKLGLFVIGAIAAGILVLVIIGSGRWFERKVIIETYFKESVQGLDIGSKLKYRGVTIGEVTRITFTYTRCPLPTFCPLMDQNFATLQRRLAEDPDVQGRVRLITITMDPDHDTPAVLAAHAQRLKADPAVWTFLTGDRVTIDRLAQKFGVGIVRDADPTQITHNLRTSLVGPDGHRVITPETFSGACSMMPSSVPAAASQSSDPKYPVGAGSNAVPSQCSTTGPPAAASTSR